MSTLRIRAPLAVGFACLLAPLAAAQDVHDLSGHTGTVRGLAFSPDGKRLASCSLDNTVRVWDVAARKEQRNWRAFYNGFTSAAWSPDGKKLATTSQNRFVPVWNPDTGAAWRTFTGHMNLAYGAVFSTDSKTVISCAHEPMVRVWEAETAREVRYFKADDGGVVWGLALSPDGKTLATAGQDKSVRLFDPATGTELRRLTGHTDAVMAVAFSPDGHTLVSTGNDKTVRLWEIATGKERLKIDAHTSYVRSVAVAGDGRTIASGGFDHTVRLWDAFTGKELKKLEGHKQAVWAVRFAPDDKLLASGSDDHLVKLWKVQAVTERALAKGEKLAERDAAARWNDLGAEDAAKAYKAMAALSGDPESAVAVFKDKLKPVKELDSDAEKQVEKQIGLLDNDDFATRKKAMEALVALGAPAAPQLRRAVGKAGDVDVKLRLFVVLRQLEGSSLSPAQLRTLRALETLERLGNDGAKEVLQGLAKGVAEAWLTREAKVSLARIERRAGAKK
jgi:Tol biopolymer transport system component